MWLKRLAKWTLYVLCRGSSIEMGWVCVFGLLEVPRDTRELMQWFYYMYSMEKEKCVVEFMYKYIRIAYICDALKRTTLPQGKTAKGLAFIFHQLRISATAVEHQEIPGRRQTTKGKPNSTNKDINGNLNDANQCIWSAFPNVNSNAIALCLSLDKEMPWFCGISLIPNGFGCCLCLFTIGLVKQKTYIWFPGA